MTVSELIERLKNFSSDAEVYFVNGEEEILKRQTNGIGEVFEIKGHHQYTGVYLGATEW